MTTTLYSRWAQKLQQQSQRPAYLLIADLIAEGINNGELQPRDRLPPLRDLALVLALNYTTVTRGYAEARRRGLIDSRPGTGSFVRGKVPGIPLNGGSSYEMTMNAPIEPEGTVLEEAMRSGALNLFNNSDMLSLMRYQDFGGTAEDKSVAIHWLQRSLKIHDVEEVLVCPGIHSVLVGLLTLLGRKGGTICLSDLVYPGIKAIASQLNISLHALPCDENGPLSRAFEDRCRLGGVNALYINPTLQNPSTLTIPLHRRESLAEIARRYSVPIIEDDAYAALPQKTLPTFTELVPEISWYVTGMSKCFGPGLRIAYVKGPGKRATQLLAGALRALTVMSSPFTNALARQWITDGTAERMLIAIRQEARIRQQLASHYLAGIPFRADAEGFHLWLPLPKALNLNPSDAAVKLREQGVSAVSSVAFCTDNNPPDALRLCLGGTASREQCEESLKTVAEMLEHPHHFASMIR